ncbi:rad2 superfamily protein mus201 [Amblyomma americanum]
MGVHGLWQVLEPAGKPIALETLENKVLAVDVSLWLHQAVKGYRDAQGSPMANAHLLGLLQRVCKLLFYGVKPVFVFDGGVPQLKKQTLAARQERRTVAQESAQRKARLLLLKARHRGSKRPAPKAPVDDLYVLPPLPEHWNKLYKVEDDDWLSGGEAVWELASLDCDSEEFAALPAETRHRALLAMQHYHRWGPSKKAPKNSEAFSAYQLQGLLRKRTLQQRAEEARQEMRPELSFWGEEAQVSRVASQPNTHQVVLNTSSSKHLLLSESQEGEAGESQIRDWKAASPQEKKERNINASQASNPSPSLSVHDPAVLKWLSEECSPNKTTGNNAANSGSTLSQGIKSPIEAVHPQVKRVVDFTSEQGETEEKVTDLRDEADTSVKRTCERTEPTVVEPEKVHMAVTKGLEKTTNGTSTSSALPTLPTDLSVSAKPDSRDEERLVTSTEPSVESGEKDVSQDKRQEPVEQEDSDAASDRSGSQDRGMDSSGVVEGSEAASKDACDVVGLSDEEEKDEELLAAIQASLLEQNKKEADQEPTPSSSFWKPPRTEEEKRELQMREQDLEQEAARQQRHAASLTDVLVKECQELLALLGQPYVVSPGEAEAQCAWLEQQGLSQGVVTDDSDAWLFGAQCVYRHLFRPDRRPTRFLLKDLASQFGLDRQKLVAFALLCGSDYTTGVNGVGPVTAMEVLSEFKGDDAISLLEQFRTWLQQAKEEKVLPGSKTRSHLVRLSLEAGFPSSRVVQAYLEPTVDESRETFSWGTPDLDALRTYAYQKLGWSREKLDDLLLPVLKRMGIKQKQTRMDQYLDAYQAPPKPKLFPSKRLTKAVGKLAPSKRAKAQEPQLSEDSDSS